MGRAEIAEQVARLSSLIPQLHELQTGHFRNVVIGGGPAGYAVTSTLLDGDSHPTLWIDPAFQAGRLARYLEVRVFDAAAAPLTRLHVYSICKRLKALADLIHCSSTYSCDPKCSHF